MYLSKSLINRTKFNPHAVLILSMDGTFAMEEQVMALMEPAKGEWEVVWLATSWEENYKRDQELKAKGLPPAESQLEFRESRRIDAAFAESLTASLSAIHVPLGNRCEGSVDDGCIVTVHVNTRSGYAELQWNTLRPDGWEIMEQWFSTTWNRMRACLGLPVEHMATLIQ